MRLSGADRRGNARLRQRRDEAERLEQHRLAAGVRSGDEQRALVGIHLEIERHDVDALREQQRMPSVADREALARRRRASAGAQRELDREARARVQRVELDERVERREHRVAMRTQRVGELAQNALDLLELLGLELANAIAELDRRRRLDEQRAARRRRVVHDAADGAARLRAAPG